jgi:predicted small lipoprotein YifL
MKNLINSLVTVLLVSTLFITGCKETISPVAPVDQSITQTIQDKNTPPPGVTFLRAITNPKTNSINAIVTASATLDPEVGGVVGGTETFGNYVLIPPYTFNETTTFTVTAADEEFTWVEFGPSMQFNGNVFITLDFSRFGLTKKEAKKLKVYYFNEENGQWKKVKGPYHYTETSVSFRSNHFSRYGWGN